MIDPATFRRINPNYVISSVKSRNNDAEDDTTNNYFDASDNESDDDGGECTDCCCGGDGEGEGEGGEEADLKRIKFILDDKGHYHVVTKEEENEKAMKVEKVADDDEEEVDPVFTDDELLTGSPVVLGWAFNEKLWRENHLPCEPLLSVI